MYYTGRVDIDLTGKCGTCNHYKPFTKKNRKGLETQYCRGYCLIAKGCSYRQRTDKCIKWEG